MFNKVLAATARPLECDESILSAGPIVQHDNGKLLILHVLEAESTIYRNYVKHYRTGEEILGDKTYQEEVKEEILKNCHSELAPLEKLEIRVATGFPWMEIVKQAREESVDLEEFLNEIPDNIDAEIDTWGGVYPDIEIIKYARRKDLDLIVMGSHSKMKGKSEGARWYVGSAVERVSARAVCPVVVITDPTVLEKY